MNKIVLAILFFLMVNISNSQSLENIKIGKSFDERKEELVGETYFFGSNDFEQTNVCYYLSQLSNFDELSLIVRIIKLKGETQQIYSSETIDIEPSWNYIFGSVELPKGEFIIKVYNKANKVIGYSRSFIIS